MKTDQKVATSAGLAGALYVEESILWLLDRALDVLLAYKDTLLQLLF